jgi:hypothetical protein
MRLEIRRVVTEVAVAAFIVVVATINATRGAEMTTMDPSRRAQVLTDVLGKLHSGQKVDPSEFREFSDAQNDGATTGLAVGAHVPDFSLPDQTGKQHSLRDLIGPNGLLLVFSRSADW